MLQKKKKRSLASMGDLLHKSRLSHLHPVIFHILEMLIISGSLHEWQAVYCSTAASTVNSVNSSMNQSQSSSHTISGDFDRLATRLLASSSHHGEDDVGDSKLMASAIIDSVDTIRQHHSVDVTCDIIFINPHSFASSGSVFRQLQSGGLSSSPNMMENDVVETVLDVQIPFNVSAGLSFKFENMSGVTSVRTIMEEGEDNSVWIAMADRYSKYLTRNSACVGVVLDFRQNFDYKEGILYSKSEMSSIMPRFLPLVYRMVDKMAYKRFILLVKSAGSQGGGEILRRDDGVSLKLSDSVFAHLSTFILNLHGKHKISLDQLCAGSSILFNQYFWNAQTAKLNHKLDFSSYITALSESAYGALETLHMRQKHLSPRVSTSFPLPRCQVPFQGKVGVRVSCKGLPPFNIWRPDGTIFGVDVDILGVIEEKYNFTIQLMNEKYMALKLPGPGNVWDGVVGSVHNATSLFGIGNPALDSERYTVIDYTSMLYPLETVYIAPKPRPLPPWMNPLNPFGFDVWMTGLAMAVVSSIVLSGMFLIQQITFKEMRRNLSPQRAVSHHQSDPEHRGVSRRVTFSPTSSNEGHDLKASSTDNHYSTNIKKLSYVHHPPSSVSTVSKAAYTGTTYIISSMLKQGPSEHSFRWRCLKMFAFVWSAYGIFFTTAYTCNLRAFIIAVPFEKPVDSAEDILNLGIKFYIPLGTSLETSLKSSPLNVHKELVRNAEIENGGFILQKGWLPPTTEKEMLRYRGAFLFPKEPVQMNYDNFKKKFGNQPFRISKSVGFSYYCGYLLPKHVWWREDVNRYLQRFSEMGMYEKLKERYYPLGILSGADEELESEGIKTFQLYDVMGLFFLLAFGLVISGIAIIVEVVMGLRM